MSDPKTNPTADEALTELIGAVHASAAVLRRVIRDGIDSKTSPAVLGYAQNVIEHAPAAIAEIKTLRPPTKVSVQ